MIDRRSTLVVPVIAALSALSPTARAQQAIAPAPALESPGSVAGRVVAETLMGSGLATVGFVAGPKVTGVACRQCLFAAGFVGANATFPIGVYWGGNLVRGEGSFWLTAAAPWIVSATAFTALVFDKDYDGRPAFQIGVVGGAIAAPLSIVLYEVTHASRRASALRPCARWYPQVTMSPRGDGLAFHVAGAF